MSSSIKRKRSRLVCKQCSQRKVKCDKKRPCSSCLKVSLDHVCTYDDVQKATRNGNESIQLNPNGVSRKGPYTQYNSSSTSDTSEIELLKERLVAVESILNNRTEPKETLSGTPSLDNAFNQTYNYKSEIKFHDPKFPGNAVPGVSDSDLDDYIKVFEPIKSIEDRINLSLSFESLIGVNPYHSRDETINLYKDDIFGHTPSSLRKRNVGPFAWLSVLKRDRVLLLIRTYVLKSDIQKEIKLLMAPANVELSETFEDIESDEDLDLIPYNLKKAKISRKINNLNERNNNVSGTSLSSQLQEELQIIEKVKLALPHQKVIWLHFHRFFRYVYPFMGFIDEVTFKNELEQIIGQEGYKDKRIGNVKIEKRINLATIGILFVCLRLSYLSLFIRFSLKSQAELPQDINYLLANKIDTNFADLAHQCLYQFQLFRQSNLRVLQCALLLKIYNKVAPEDGNGSDGGDSIVFNGMLVQLACSMGLNREPDNFDEIEKDERTNNLGRKIWYFLVLSDFVQSYTFGNPLITNSMYYDTKFPYYKEGNENIVDTKFDKTITGIYRFCKLLINGPMKCILHFFLNIRVDTNIWEVTKHLNRFESYNNEIFGKLGDYTNSLEKKDMSYTIYKTLKADILLSMSGFCLTIYYYFFIFYERKKKFKISFFYLRKMLSLCIIEFMPNFIPLIYNCLDKLGEGSSMIINPAIEMTIHKINEIFISIIVKVNFLLHNLGKAYNHREKLLYDEGYKLRIVKLIELSDNLFDCLRVSLTSISRMSTIYYYSWKITKQHGFILQAIQKEEFYIENTNFPADPEEIELNESEILLEISEKGLSKAEEFYSKNLLGENQSPFKRKRTKVHAWEDLIVDTIQTDIQINDVSSNHTDINFNYLEGDSIWLPMEPWIAENMEMVNDINNLKYNDDEYFYLPFFENLN